VRLGLALALGLLGGALVTLGARRPWEDHGALDVPTAPLAHASVAVSLGAVIILGSLVVGVTRAWGRRAAGVLVALAGFGAVVVVVGADAEWVGWRIAALLGSVLAAAAGILSAARGHTWASMSGRYDAPTGVADESDPWKAIDRGEDPTL
jgi:Tryptophan-associated transmembrane protein (Trp_oprn_chp)